jgi:hypothetical protein
MLGSKSFTLVCVGDVFYENNNKKNIISNPTQYTEITESVSNFILALINIKTLRKVILLKSGQQP